MVGMVHLSRVILLLTLSLPWLHAQQEIDGLDEQLSMEMSDMLQDLSHLRGGASKGGSSRPDSELQQEVDTLTTLAGELRLRLQDAQTVASENQYLKERLEDAQDTYAKTQLALGLCSESATEMSRLEEEMREKDSKMQEMELLMARTALDSAAELRKQRAKCDQSLLEQVSAVH